MNKLESKTISTNMFYMNPIAMIMTCFLIVSFQVFFSVGDLDFDLRIFKQQEINTNKEYFSDTKDYFNDRKDFESPEDSQRSGFDPDDFDVDYQQLKPHKFEVLHNCSRHLLVDSKACAKSYYQGAKGIYEATMHENDKNYYDHTDRKNYIHYCIVDRTWKVLTGPDVDGNFAQFIKHKNCKENCPENCPKEGWQVQQQLDGNEYFEDKSLYINADDGFCNEGVIVNSTGRLKELEKYFSSRQDYNTTPILLIGLYTFVECPNGDPIYKHTNSEVYLLRIPAFEGGSRKKVWSISRGVSTLEEVVNGSLAFHLSCNEVHPYHCEKRRWKVKANDNGTIPLQNNTDQYYNFESDPTMSLKCLDDTIIDENSTETKCPFPSVCSDTGILNGIKASIKYIGNKTEVYRQGVHDNVSYVWLEHSTTLRLKCTMTPVVPHVEGDWHTCRWAEHVNDFIRRQCSSEYLKNSTFDKDKVVECESPDGNIITVDNEGDDSCILEITPANHVPSFKKVEWYCTFHECESEDCSMANGCTAETKIEVKIIPQVTEIPDLAPPSSVPSLQQKRCNILYCYSLLSLIFVFIEQLYGVQKY